MKALRLTLALGALALVSAGCFGTNDAKSQPGSIGDACTVGTDCQSGFACDKALPGGYCVAQCAGGCPQDSQCATVGGQQLCLLSCQDDTGCRQGYACKGGVCMPPCSSDSDCTTGESCQGGVCTANGIGATCTAPSDCSSGLCAKSLPGGYCTQSCDNGKTCPTGTQCVTYGGKSYCFDGCAKNADCRTGYVCSNGVCDAACSGDADCGGGEVCQNQACVGAGVGETCASGSDCPSGLTCDTSVSGGYCTQTCTAAADCPVGAICGVMKGTRTCLADCRTSADCASGQSCILGVCNVPCGSDSDCGSGMYCDTTSGQCHQKAVGGGGVTTVDLGTVPLGTPTSFQVDSKTFGVEIVAVGDQGANYEISSVTNPSGTELVNQSNPYGGPLRVVPDTEVATAQIPNSDSSAVALTPGVWHFQVITDSGSAPHVTILMRTSPTGAEVGGTVPLNVFLAPNAYPGTTAANAASDQSLQAILGRWDVFYSNQYGNPADIPLGTIHYYDISSQYSDITTTPQYESMFAQYGRGDGLNLFFVRSLSIGGQSAVAGVAGGIPGPARISGTLHSGVVIEVQPSQSGSGIDTRITGDDMSHECGHFQGLFHTTELDAAHTQDLISDTPECTNMPTQNSMGSCSQDAYKNLMFPMLTGEQSILTAGQAKVVQANPGIH